MASGRIFETLRRESLTDQAYARLRDAIIAGHLRPGALHSVNELAERFGVSRTPVREAAIQLATQGMVSIERNKGLRIVQLSAQDLLETLILRLTLEPGMTTEATYKSSTSASKVWLRELSESLDGMRAAAGDRDVDLFVAADREFHSIILSASGFPQLAETVERARMQVIVWRMWTANKSRSLEQIISEHERIVSCIGESDARRAGEAMFDHLLSTGNHLIMQEGSSELASSFTSWGAILQQGWDR